MSEDGSPSWILMKTLMGTRHSAAIACPYFGRDLDATKYISDWGLASDRVIATSDIRFIPPMLFEFTKGSMTTRPTVRRSVKWSRFGSACYYFICFAGSSGGEFLTAFLRSLFVVDGPLAMFGHPARLSPLIKAELKRLNKLVRDGTNNDLLIIGVEKTRSIR